MLFRSALDPVVIANRTFTSLKNILLITQNPALSAKDCGMSDKQASFLRRKYRVVNTTAIQAKLKFLADFDLKLKTSQLDISKRDKLTYLINNLLFKI